MTAFELVEPSSLGEALGLLDPDDPAVRPIAGGTALMLMMKTGLYRPRRLVSLRALGRPLTMIAATPEGGLDIGAMVRLAQIERSAVVRQAAPVVADTLLTHSNVRVRNVATVGGNLAHGDPHMDLPPVLIALGASVATASPKGERVLPVEDLFAGYYETVLERNELITELRIPAQGKRRAAYLKVTAGSADDWPALGVAASVEAEGKAIKSIRLVASAATEKATRLKAAEKVLAGTAIDAAALARAGDAAAGEVEILADVRGSAAYKRELLRVHVGRAVQQALASNGAP